MLSLYSGFRVMAGIETATPSPYLLDLE